MIQIFKILAVLMFSVGVHAVVVVPARCQTGRCPDDGPRGRYLDGGVIFLDVASESPFETLSKKRPPRGVFEIKPILSIGLQFAAHLQALFKCLELCAPFASNTESVPDGAFSPSVLNTAIFLLTSCVQLNTFACNYVGRPFTESLREHKPMLYVLLRGMRWSFYWRRGSCRLYRIISGSSRRRLPNFARGSSGCCWRIR